MLLHVLRAVAANFIVMISALGFGTLLLPLLPDSFSRLNRFLCTFVAGFGILGITILLVGLVSYTPWTIGAILAAGVVLGALRVSGPWQIYKPIAKFPASLVLALLTLTALSGLAEPVGNWDIDTVAYHLVGPKVWLRDGIVRPIPDNMNTSYPSTVEMVFGALYCVGGDRAPGFSASWTLALLLLAASSLALRCGLERSAAWWVAALLLAMPAVYAGSISSFIDGIYATFVLMALRIGLDATKRAHFIACGILCGLAMATKYPALLALPVLALSISWRGDKKFQSMLPNAITIVAVACAVAAPIYLKNWYFLGSPVYPPPAWANHYLHVKYFPTEAIRNFYAANVQRGRGHGRGLLHFFSLPFNLTYHTADFSGGGGIGLVPLAFAPFGIFAAWREPFARRLALIASLLFFLWFITMQESRYLYHVYAISVVFAVLGWRFIALRAGPRARVLCTAIVAISLAYGLFMILPPLPANVRAAFSAKAAAKRRATSVPWVDSFNFINHDSSVTRVLFLDRSVPPYYSDKNYVKPFGQYGELVYPDAPTAADILARLPALQVSHILDVQSTVSDFQVPANRSDLRLIFERPGQRIYEVLEDQREK
jgi:hypothetical protein